jgi:hypothetical protein
MTGTRPRVAALVAALAMLSTGCEASPRPSPSPFQTSLTLSTELAECPWVGGCAAYVSIAPRGVEPAGEDRLEDIELGVPKIVAGLPPSIGPGRYVVRARLAAVSDHRTQGQPAAETTVAECQIEIAGISGEPLAAEVDLSLVFQADSCEFHEMDREVNS